MIVIWWSGRGLLALLIMVASFALPMTIALVLYAEYPDRIPQWIIPLSQVVGWSIGGVTCWKLGRA